MKSQRFDLGPNGCLAACLSKRTLIDIRVEYFKTGAKNFFFLKPEENVLSNMFFNYINGIFQTSLLQQIEAPDV